MYCLREKIVNMTLETMNQQMEDKTTMIIQS